MKLRGPPEPASHEIFTGRLLPDLTLEEMGISIISIFGFFKSAAKRKSPPQKKQALHTESAARLYIL